jgi:hypothetical protein
LGEARDTEYCNSLSSIYSEKNDVIPIEVKINLGKVSFTALNYFSEAYKLEKFRIVGIDGYENKVNHIYPWEL